MMLPLNGRVIFVLTRWNALKVKKKSKPWAGNSEEREQ